MIEYFGEMKTEFENTLGCLPGAQMGSNHEQNRGLKTRDTLPFNCLELCRNWEFGTGNNDGNAALSGGSSLCLSFAFQQQNFPTWRVLTS